MSAVMPDAQLRRTVQQAALWFVRLTEQPGCPRLQADCARWRALDPAHERGWQRIARVGAQGEALPAFTGQALRRPTDAGRRALVRAAVAAALALPAACLTRASAPQGQWYHAGTGERRALQLSDGTRLWLNTRSAVRTSLAEPDVLCLTEGEAVFDLAARSGDPLRVRTAHGELEARSGRFGLRVYDDRSVASVDVGALQVRSRASGARADVPAGMQVSFDARHIEPAIPWSNAQLAWLQGVLAVENARLDDFLVELGRHRPGRIGCDARVAGLRLSGAFQLDDTTAVLAMLPAMLAVRVRYRTPYWVTVLPRDTTI